MALRPCQAPASVPARCCDKFLYGFKGAPPARQADRGRPDSRKIRGTCTESVNELGSDATSGEGCRGLSPQVAGQPGPLPLARERTGRVPLPRRADAPHPAAAHPAVTRR